MFRPLALSFPLTSVAIAQTFVESPVATSPGRVGLEAGVTVVVDEFAAVFSPEGLALIGLVPRVEVGAQIEGVWERAADRVDAGVLALMARSWSRWGAFGEAALASTEAGPDAVLHAGVLFALSPSIQLDARLGAGLTAAAPDAFAGVGIRVGL